MTLNPHPVMKCSKGFLFLCGFFSCCGKTDNVIGEIKEGGWNLNVCFRSMQTKCFIAEVKVVLECC